MGYSVTALLEGDGIGRQTATALEALAESVEVFRKRDWPHVTNDAGRFISMARLLRAARAEAVDPAGRERFTNTVADWFEIQGAVAIRSAHERYLELGSEEHQEELRTLEALGLPIAHRRQRDAEELQRISPILFGQGAWRDTGRGWAGLFGTSVPEPVTEELAARLGDKFSEAELNAGVREGLEALAERRRSDRGTRARRPSADPAARPPVERRGHERRFKP
jgi:hypothetical protein